MFAEMDAATAAGMPDAGKPVAIATKYGVAIEPLADSAVRAAHIAERRSRRSWEAGK